MGDDGEKKAPPKCDTMLVCVRALALLLLPKINIKNVNNGSRCGATRESIERDSPRESESKGRNCQSDVTGAFLVQQK